VRILSSKDILFIAVIVALAIILVLYGRDYISTGIDEVNMTIPGIGATLSGSLIVQLFDENNNHVKVIDIPLGAVSQTEANKYIDRIETTIKLDKLTNVENLTAHNIKYISSTILISYGSMSIGSGTGKSLSLVKNGSQLHRYVLDRETLIDKIQKHVGTLKPGTHITLEIEGSICLYNVSSGKPAICVRTRNPINIVLEYTSEGKLLLIDIKR